MKSFIYLACACACLLSGYAQTPPAGVPDLKTLKETVDSCEINLHAKRPPLIGISITRMANGGSGVGATYINAVLKAGGAPVLIPATTDAAALRHIVANLDGLVMTGGEDINPLWYGEQPNQLLGEVDPLRDVYDLKLLKLATDRNIPLLGICRGAQLVNTAFGGTLYQDIPSQRGGNMLVKHSKRCRANTPRTPLPSCPAASWQPSSVKE